MPHFMILVIEKLKKVKDVLDKKATDGTIAFMLLLQAKTQKIYMCNRLDKTVALALEFL